MSDGHAGEEAHDIVHDLDGMVPSSATLMHESGDIEFKENKTRAYSGKNVRETSIMKSSGSSNMQIVESVNQMSAEETGTVSITPYVVKMEASVDEFGEHVTYCNRDFKENIMRKVQTIKLADTQQLNTKVEELKI